MLDLTAADVKPFIGSQNYDESRDFYVALGWQLNFDSGDFAELELGGCRFCLQDYYQRQWCENSMLHITIADAAAWYAHATAVLAARRRRRCPRFTGAAAAVLRSTRGARAGRLG